VPIDIRNQTRTTRLAVQARALERDKGELEARLAERDGAAAEAALRADLLRARLADAEAAQPSGAAQTEQVRVLPVCSHGRLPCTLQ
jgi:hypothetical protein